MNFRGTVVDATPRVHPRPLGCAWTQPNKTSSGMIGATVDHVLVVVCLPCHVAPSCCTPNMTATCNFRRGSGVGVYRAVEVTFYVKAVRSESTNQ